MHACTCVSMYVGHALRVCVCICVCVRQEKVQIFKNKFGIVLAKPVVPPTVQEEERKGWRGRERKRKKYLHLKSCLA